MIASMAVNVLGGNDPLLGAVLVDVDVFMVVGVIVTAIMAMGVLVVMPAGGYPEHGGADPGQGRQDDAAQQYPDMELGRQNDLQHLVVVKQDLHDAERAAEADRAQLLDVVNVAIFDGMRVCHELILS
jgi:hypothetical protein